VANKHNNTKKKTEKKKAAAKRPLSALSRIPPPFGSQFPTFYERRVKWICALFVALFRAKIKIGKESKGSPAINCAQNSPGASSSSAAAAAANASRKLTQNNIKKFFFFIIPPLILL
jgi:hypothetical protein